jgi:hypothetical protein
MRLGSLILELITLVPMVAIPTNLCAQTTNSGGLAGTVTDPGNAVVPDAVLELKNNAKP